MLMLLMGDRVISVCACMRAHTCERVCVCVHVCMHMCALSYVSFGVCVSVCWCWCIE